MFLLDSSDQILQPWSQFGIVGLILAVLVVIVRWMMSRLDKTIDALTRAVDEFSQISREQISFQSQLKDLLGEHLDKVERLLERGMSAHIARPPQRPHDAE